MVERIRTFYETQNANINRGMHALAEEATVAYEDARKTVARFINATHANEVLFTRNATESINLVARTLGETFASGDAIALSLLEHHSNIIPWMQLKERRGVALEWIRLTEDGCLDLPSLEKILAKKKTKLVAITALSNVLGTVTPLREVIRLAHDTGALVLVDASQLVAHADIDVRALDADFLVFSGHKLYGPTGVGVLYGKRKLLEKMPPFLGGGDMIATVDQHGFHPAELPRKFEAGTPSIADAVGLAEAIDWMTETGTSAMHAHTQQLLHYARAALRTVEKLKILGSDSTDDVLGCVSFTLSGVHPHDLTEVLGKKNICLRAGHHCAQILHRHLGIHASTRMSFGAYNTEEEIDTCVSAIEAAKKLLS